MNEASFDLLATILSSALVGSLLSLAGIWLTNVSNTKNLRLQLNHQEEQDRKSCIREKGEELYLLVDKWLGGLFGYYLRRNFVLQGKMTNNECLDLDIKSRTDDNFDFGKIEMLIDVYFSGIRTAYDEVIVHRDELNKIERDYKREGQGTNVNSQTYLDRYVAAQKRIEQTGDLLKKQIAALICSSYEQVSV